MFPYNPCVWAGKLSGYQDEKSFSVSLVVRIKNRLMRLVLLTLVFILIGLQEAAAQYNSRNAEVGESKVFQLPDPSRRGESGIRVMFYNVENLFDVRNDSLKQDDEYAPGGMRGWSMEKLKKKLINISKVIISVGGWEPPEIVGLCEVENRFVLSKLIHDTPLKNFGYRFVHFDSPDPRGIDVALLYRPDKFKVVASHPVPIHFTRDTNLRTRDILYVKGVVSGKDTLHIFVNHWPSRFGGYTETIDKRVFVAGTLRNKIDSLFNGYPLSKILVMGDLNDEPADVSVKDTLKAKLDSLHLKPCDLYNQIAGIPQKWYQGTIKDRQMWVTIDQIIVSGTLLADIPGLFTTPHSARVFNAPALLQRDEAWLGYKPFRTYYGAAYIGGFSDHLPVYTDLFFNHQSKRTP
jgi:hypothetical protein